MGKLILEVVGVVGLKYSTTFCKDIYIHLNNDITSSEEPAMTKRNFLLRGLSSWLSRNKLPKRENAHLLLPHTSAEPLFSMMAEQSTPQCTEEGSWGRVTGTSVGRS